MKTRSKAAISLLQDLIQNGESPEITDCQGIWRTVYLPNAQGGRSAKSFGGLLRSLQQEGLYRPIEEYFGEVRIS